MRFKSGERNTANETSRHSNNAGIKQHGYCDAGAPGKRGAPGGGCRQSVSAWARALSAAERQRLYQLLLQGAVANGFATELWTLQRIAKVIERKFSVTYCETNI